MKILHTADWHLGQKFLNVQYRTQEHELAINWIIETATEQAVDMIIIAGDIFDMGNPPSAARSLYFRFLTKIANTSCRHIVVIGGNHDSPSMLDAPKELLSLLNVHVLGAASEKIEDDVLELFDTNGEIEAVIAMVPFLRDQDIRRSVSGETSQERIARIKEGIYNHYEKIGAACKSYKKAGVPIIATGHLYAKGAEAAADQDNIYIGNRENISAEQFPKIFDYVALGHIHRAQFLGTREEVRYSGSIIPLRFKETLDEKSVTIIDFDASKIAHIDTIKIPEFRRLKTIEGDLDKVKASLKRFSEKGGRDLITWVELIIHMDKIIPNLNEEIKEFTKDMNIQILKVRTRHQHHALNKAAVSVDLEELDPLEVFRKKCTSQGFPPDDMKELESTFLELRDWMNEQ